MITVQPQVPRLLKKSVKLHVRKKNSYLTITLNQARTLVRVTILNGDFAV